MDKNLKDLIETVGFIKDNMATKDDLAELRERVATKDDIASLRSDIASIKDELREIRSELESIRRRLDVLEELVRGHDGYAKEVDHLLERVANIEKHLGIKAGTSK